jgi:hypothetical protein
VERVGFEQYISHSLLPFLDTYEQLEKAAEVVGSNPAQGLHFNRSHYQLWG